MSYIARELNVTIHFSSIDVNFLFGLSDRQ